MNKVVIVMLMLIASVVCTRALPVRHKYSNPASGEFPILGWYSIRGLENQTPERYREMRQCGFNLSFPLIDSLSEVKAALEASRGTGIKIIATSAELAENPESVIAQIGSHPQLAGYFF